MDFGKNKKNGHSRVRFSANYEKVDVN